MSGPGKRTGAYDGSKYEAGNFEDKISEDVDRQILGDSNSIPKNKFRHEDWSLWKLCFNHVLRIRLIKRLAKVFGNCGSLTAIDGLVGAFFTAHKEWIDITSRRKWMDFLVLSELVEAIDRAGIEVGSVRGLELNCKCLYGQIYFWGLWRSWPGHHMRMEVMEEAQG
ncbi:hypothetical protein BY996DRAFT_6465359 [Phakopsora pachyrhizi]|nr:hypothetical protein BY996DRAFT_6465359 [Phakopsora pachyrhizi]